MKLESLKIELTELNNDAFSDNQIEEVAIVLEKLANRLRSNDGLDSHNLKDINGNKVGEVSIIYRLFG